MAAVVIEAHEIRNNILMGIRRSRISQPDSEQFLLSLNELNVRLSEPVSYDEIAGQGGRRR